MKDELVWSQLEALAYKLGIAIRYENVNWNESSDRRGLCRIRGEYVLFIDSQSTTKEKIRVAVGALKQFDLGDIQVMPAIRDLLEGTKE
jgi:hypothetical protein